MLLLLYHQTQTTAGPVNQLFIVSTERIDEEMFRITMQVATGTLLPATFYVYIEGTLAQTLLTDTGTATMLIRVPVGANPFIFVSLDPDEVPPLAYPGSRTIVWTEVEDDAVRFRVDQFLDAVWTTVAERDATVLGVYQYTTEYLDDSTTAQFRIVPLDSNNCEGNITTVDIYMVRHPDPPVVAYSYNPATGDLTITEV